MPNLTDPDADEKYAPKIDTQPGSTDMSEFEKDFDGSQPPIMGNNLRGREDKAAKQGLNNARGGDVTGAKDLENKEQEMPPDRSGFSAADDMREKLGRGYTGKGSTKSKGLSKLYSSNSKFKKKIAIAGAAAGGSLIAGVLVFLALLPLKIEHIVQNLETRFGAATASAMNTEVDSLVNGYVESSVVTSVLNGKCHSTVSPDCHVVAKGTGPVGSLYAAWAKTRFENKLATKYGVIIGKDVKTNRFFISIKGNGDVYSKDDLLKLQRGEGSLFSMDGVSETTRNELRHALDDSFKAGTLWDKTYGRFKYASYLSKNFGIKFCVIACSLQDKFTDSVANKKLAAKAYLLQRLVPEKYGVILACISAPTSCDTEHLTASPGDDTAMSSGQRQLNELLATASDHFTEESLAKLVTAANQIGKDGISKYIVANGVKASMSRFFGDETAQQISGQIADKAVPVVGWLLFVAALDQAGAHVGDMVRDLNYATNAASSVELYSTYRTVASEMQSGHVDPTELGSFTDALTTNLSGSASDQADATSTPLYNNLFGNTDATATASVFNNLFPGTASADSTQASRYMCDDGKPVPAGKLICPEESLVQDNGVADNIQNTIQTVNSYGFSYVAKVLNAVNGAIGAAFTTAFNSTCKITTIPFTSIGCEGAVNKISGLFGDFGSWIESKLIISPFSDNMSGGRSFDMMVAGADVANNGACQANLGCSKISTVAATAIQNKRIIEQKQEFDNQSMFARIFSTNSPYSLVSRLAMDMPTSILTATNNGIASLITNPFGKIMNGFSNIFSGNHAFAATTPQSDPFGIVQYGYPDSQVPSNPEQYWSNNCVAGPMGIYDESSGELDVSPWLNNETDHVMPDGTHVNFAPDGPNTTQDPNTGEMVTLKPNPCLLIQSTVQSAGAIFDTSLVPADAQNAGSD